MKRFVYILVGIILLISATVSHAQPTSYLPTSHRAYDFLERMELRGFIRGGHLGTKPLTRLSVAELLDSMGDRTELLSAADREEYECLIAEFRPDLATDYPPGFDDYNAVDRLPGFLGDILYRNRRNLFSVYGDSYSLFFDPVIVREATLSGRHGTDGDDNVYLDTHGFVVRGTVGEHAGFSVDARDSREWGSRVYPPATSTTMPGRGYASFKGDHAEFDETHAHLTYTNGPFMLTWGRGQTRWGRGADGVLGLSSSAAPYDFLRLETGFWKLRFVFITAELKQYPPIAQFYYKSPPGTAADSVAVKKRMSAHRLEIDLTDRLALGLYETVVYGGRYEWSYLNPLMFLKGAEHANGDHDNAGIGVDARWLVGGRSMLYGEFFVDDITTTKLGTDWYGNKLAYQAGVFADEPLGIRDIDGRVEYTRISPWVYTNRIPVNSYTHYGDVLGHDLGPNADLVTATVRKRFSRRFHAVLSASRSRHGTNPPGVNVGGDSLEGFREGDSKHAKFLAGNVDRVNRVGADFTCEIAWQCFVNVGYTYEELNGDGISIVRLGFRLNK